MYGISKNLLARYFSFRTDQFLRPGNSAKVNSKTYCLL